MDFSSNAFRTSAPSKVSDDTLSHANLVMACRWGWSSTPGTSETSAPNPVSSTCSSSSPPFRNVRSKRFAPCQGRLYHQLLCSHRVRTDVVEDCGANCVEPFGSISGIAFMCNECIQAEAIKIWQERKSQHNTMYPAMNEMTKEQYDQWYLEHRQMETEYAHHRAAYERELRATMRPSNICSALETSKDEMEFATELDSLSLSLMASNEGAQCQSQIQQTRNRISLPNDASEQLHWDLNTLALGRGSCGVEYTASQSPSREAAIRRMAEEELWTKPRG